MTKKLPKSALYSIRKGDNLYSAMHRDVELLYNNRCYVTCTMVILCCIDALAAADGKATSGKFGAFAKKYFPELCSGLDGTVPGKEGARVLYDIFRNGFTHLFSPKPGFAIAEDHELDGHFVDKVEVDGVGELMAINADRLSRAFLQLIDRLREAAA